MRIKFDGHQEFQLQAMEAVCDLFRGQPLASALATVSFEAVTGEVFGELGVANRLLVSQAQIVENLADVQKRHGIAVSADFAGMNFSVEMETGTGKTYVYLRTAYELNARFGFKKFVVVVPTVAIREGVQKSIELTRDHFGDIYGKVPCETWTYDSSRLSRLRQFAASTSFRSSLLTSMRSTGRAT